MSTSLPDKSSQLRPARAYGCPEAAWVLAATLWIAVFPAVLTAGSNPKQMLADRLAALSGEVLSLGTGKPGRGQVAVARALLDEATRLQPGSAELWRLSLEALDLAGGEEKALQAAIGAYLRLAPRDEVVQWRLVQLLAARAQTVEERLEVYRRLLEGERAAGLAPALRSRIAFEAARLHGASGRTDRFAALLKQAMSLDPANGQAAAEAYVFLLQRDASSVEKTQALLNLLVADPANPAVRAELGSVLLNCGLPGPALAWLDSALSLWAQGEGVPGPRRLELAVDRSLALWGSGRRQQAIRFVRSMIERGEAEGEPNGVGTASLPAALAGILVGLHQEGDEAPQAAEAFTLLLGSLETSGNPVAREADQAGRLADRMWSRLVAGQRVHEIQAMLDRLGQLVPAGDPQLARLRGWWHLRQGRKQQARRQLAPLAAADPAAALGAALALEGDGDAATVIQELNGVVARSAGTLLGRLAAGHVRRLGGQPQLPPDCAQLAGLERQIARDIRGIPVGGAKAFRLRARALRNELPFGKPVEIELELTNALAMPLGLGASSSIRPTLIVSGTARIQGRSLVLPAQVVDLGRRFALAPARSISVRTNLSAGAMSRLLTEAPREKLHLDLVATLNPRLDESGQWRPGVLGEQVRLSPIVRLGLGAGPADFERQLAAVTHAGDDLAPAAITFLSSVAGDGSVEARERAAQAAAALIEAYQVLDGPVRSWLVANLPRTGPHARRFDAIAEDAIRRADFPDAMLALLGRADRLDAPILKLAMASRAPSVRNLATQWRSVLSATSPREGDGEEPHPAPPPGAKGR